MEPILTDEQRLLQDSVAKHLAQAGGVKRARSLRGKPGGFDPAAHVRMAGEGWFGLLASPEKGGLGLGLTELALILMEAGRVLAPEPIAAAIVTAAVLADGEPSAAGIRLLEAVLDGSAMVMPAIEGDGSPADPLLGRVRAEAGHGGLLLDGTCDGVAMAGTCSGFLVAAKGSNAPVLAYVARDARGLGIETRATVDGRPVAKLSLSAVRPELVLAEGDLAASAQRRIYDLLLFCAAAELVGVMSASLDMTVEYLKTRQQFGKPIGSFQALQHRAVDDLARIVSTRSLLFQVAGQNAGHQPGPSSLMASALKAHAGGEALKVAKSAIQMHGGIGFTDEHDIGLYLKRAMWLSAWLGNEARHRVRFAALQR